MLVDIGYAGKVRLCQASPGVVPVVKNTMTKGREHKGKRKDRDVFYHGCIWLGYIALVASRQVCFNMQPPLTEKEEGKKVKQRGCRYTLG